MTLYGFFYRKFQQFMHKRGWHHMPSHLMPDGNTQHWCQWCGLRVTIPPPDPMAIYKAAIALSVSQLGSGIILTNVKVPTQETQQ